MNNDVLKSIAATVVRAVLLWLMGVLAAKAPAVYNLANSIIGNNGGMEAVVLSLSGAAVLLGFAIYARLKSKLKQRVALASPIGTTEKNLNIMVANAPLIAKLTADPKKV